MPKPSLDKKNMPTGHERLNTATRGVAKYYSGIQGRTNGHSGMNLTRRKLSTRMVKQSFWKLLMASVRCGIMRT